MVTVDRPCAVEVLCRRSRFHEVIWKPLGNERFAAAILYYCHSVPTAECTVVGESTGFHKNLQKMLVYLRKPRQALFAVLGHVFPGFRGISRKQWKNKLRACYRGNTLRKPLLKQANCVYWHNVALVGWSNRTQKTLLNQAKTHEPRRKNLFMLQKVTLGTNSTF